jgi:hypothetical protein
VNTIFVQIASYRDPELLLTVKDCIAKAKHPKNLRFCIAHQYAPDDSPSIAEVKQSIDHLGKVIYVPANESKGACWIRSKIQNYYNDEKYTLQLDSHHRFAHHWDAILIKMLKQVTTKTSPKPILTAYLPSYDPADPEKSKLNDCWHLCFDRFMPEGPIFIRPTSIKDWQKLKGPIPSRGLSGHFIFTTGQWCRDVPYDPQLYFHGEEISLAVRSFTSGYDLYHPHKPVIWHQYTRSGAKKHWDDNSDWGKLNQISYKRVKVLLGVDGEDPNQIDWGRYGIGKVRTLHDFERYAGVEFKTRKFHKDLIHDKPAPIQYTSEDIFQSELVSIFKFCIDIHKPELPESDYDFWCVVFKDAQGKDIIRQDCNSDEIKRMFQSNPDDKFIHIWREFNSEVKPAKWTVWPHSIRKGWDNKVIERDIFNDN